MFTEGTVTSVKTTASGPDAIAQTRERLRRPAAAAVPRRVSLALLAIAAYLPLLLSRPRRLAMDTADGLYLDPARTLRLSGGRWDPGPMLGSIADRTDGHSFPMAPWFWVWHQLQIPTWIAQRVWLGTLLFFAGAGVIALLRTLDWEGPGTVAAAFAYMLSPYATQYLGVRSSVLLAWVGLPWMIHFTAQALENRGWGDPARFALVAALATGGNLAASLHLLVGPVLWVAYEVGVLRRVSRRVAATAVWRALVIGLGVTLWLIVGWWFAPRLEILQSIHHDPADLVRRATSPSDVIRSLGDWQTGTDLASARSWYHRIPVVMAASYVFPAVAVFGLATTRFRHRLYVTALLITGMALAVGAGPADHPEALARAARGLTSTTAGVLLVPTNRAVPLVALALALAFGAAVRALISARPATWWTAQIAACAVVMGGVPAFVSGKSLDGPRLLNPKVPSYWYQAAAAINGLGDTNVLELSPTAAPSYVWGSTIEPVSWSLFDNPVAARLTAPLGQRPVRDVVAAIDDQIRQGTLQPGAIAPLARLLGVGAIVVPFDGVDRAGSTAIVELLRRADGVSELGRYGDPDPEAPAVHAFRVGDVAPRLRLVDPGDLLAGDLDGRGLVDLANAGRLTGREVILGGLPSELGALDVGPGLPVVLTDGNRSERRLATDPVGSVGPTEPVDAAWGGSAGETLSRPARLSDPRLRAVSELRDGITVRASGFGSPTRLEPAFRPTSAFDSDPATAWQVSGERIGARLAISFPAAVSAASIRLAQPADTTQITRARVEIDGRTAQSVALDGRDVVVPLDVQRFRHLSIEITGLAMPPAGTGAAAGIGAYVGFSEVALDGIAPFDETVVLPDDLLAIGEPLRYRPLTVLLTRWRDLTTGRDPERVMRRAFAVPVPLRFNVTGTGHLASGVAAPEGCVTGIVSINGASVAVAVNPTPDGVEVATCQPVDVAAGRVQVTAAGEGAAVVVDRLALDSVPVDTPSGVPSTGSDERQPATVELLGSTAMTVKLDRAAPAVWLFRSAAAGDSWIASVDGTDIGAPRLANAFGGAWRLEIGDAQQHRVELRVPAQRHVGIAVIGSVIASLVALVLAVWRRTPRRPTPDAAKSPANEVPLRQRVGGVASFGLLVAVGLAGGVAPLVVAGAILLLHDYRRSLPSWMGLVPALTIFGVGVARSVWLATTDVPLALRASATPWADVLVWCAIAWCGALVVRPGARRAPPAVRRAAPPAGATLRDQMAIS